MITSRSIIKENDKYVEQLIKTSLNTYFGIVLPPAQLNCLKTMLVNDYVLFRHGRMVGATFILTILSAVLRIFNPKISMAIASVSIRQANFLKIYEKQIFNNYNFKPLNVVTIEEAVSGYYDVVLLDNITHLPEEYTNTLIKNIKNNSIIKFIGTCNGYRYYYPIAGLEKYIYSVKKGLVIIKNYKDMPEGFFDMNNLEKAKNLFDHEEEFDIEYKGAVI
jgi:hypothetical protein